MAKVIDSFFKASIIWQRHQSNNKYFYAYYNNELLLLRLNNFPDEPLLTFIRELNITDLDEPPLNWVIPW
ncbi:MAG: hypothetical protein IPP81_11455 [Chitinophagaceae bacterium]|nr:hypothetical protein [Chitinophagaceae bacterium]